MNGSSARASVSADYIIVGSGLTGAVIARILKDAGKDVVVVERRSHIGGNVYDHLHSSGIRVHTYGPHYFRTNCDQIWSFVNRFARFYRFEAVLKSYVDRGYENWPIAGSYIRRVLGDQWEPEFSGVPRNFEEACLKQMPRQIYEKFVKGYTEKQWGVPATSLSPELAKRFDVRHDDDPRLMKHRYQGLPEDGYAPFMEGMLAGIRTITNCDYLRNRDLFMHKEMLIYTGPIDELFDYNLGELKYRGQNRSHEYYPELDYFQPAVQVNNPSHEAGTHIRTIEWKYLSPAELAKKAQGTLVTRETTVTPSEPDRFEYPFPDEMNRRLYERYRARADAVQGLLVAGRLGEYRYYVTVRRSRVATGGGSRSFTGRASRRDRGSIRFSRWEWAARSSA